VKVCYKTLLIDWSASNVSYEAGFSSVLQFIDKNLVYSLHYTDLSYINCWPNTIENSDIKIFTNYYSCLLLVLFECFSSVAPPKPNDTQFL
jgi:hypothetical protein